MMTEPLKAAGEGNLSPSDHQQDAESLSGENPESSSSGTPAVEQAGEAVKVPPGGEGNLPPSDHQQDADSLSGESPESSSSGTPAVEQAGEAVKVHPGGEGNLPPSEDQMEEDTTQQDADSDSGESPESRSSGRDTVDQAGEVQYEQVDVNPEILKELRDVMSKSYKYPLDDAGLKECINEASIDPKKLLQFFQIVEARRENTDQGKKPSWWSWPKVKSFTASSQPSRIPPVYTVKVHSVTTGPTFGAVKEILEKVKNMRGSTTKVKITDYQECDIIIIFCPITSRVGSDVLAAMREIPAGDKRVILVVMHHTRDDDFSTDIKKWSETYQNVVLDVHVLFHETQPGLLKCPRNDEAVQHIQEVLKAHSK